MKKNQKGFVLTLALLMLVVMSIMGITLVALLSNDIRQNDSKDEYQQALYTAETAASLGKVRLQALVTTNSTLPQAQSLPWNTASAPSWCRPNRFSKVMNQDPNEIYIVDALPISPVKLLGDELDIPVGTLASIEKSRFNKYAIYYFITNAPTNNGSSVNITNPVATLTTKNANIVSGGNTGSTVAEKTAYKSTTSGGAQQYTIYACGRHVDSNIIAAIDVTVTLTMQ
jgi:Tfp pilus assembly protein PilX